MAYRIHANGGMYAPAAGTGNNGSVAGYNFADNTGNTFNHRASGDKVQLAGLKMASINGGCWALVNRRALFCASRPDSETKILDHKQVPRRGEVE